MLVADNGRIVYEKGFGLANAEWNIPNAPKVKYRIGSVTKQFTSMLVMQLVQEKKLKLDGTVADYLPYYRKDTGSEVTIHHLLTHTSGIPSYTDRREFRENMRARVVSPKEFVLKYCSDDLAWEPGAKYAYNNSGYFLLGAILEQVTGKRYEDLLRERIFDPLGMKDTGYDHSEAVIPNRATGYERSPAGELQNAAFIDMGAPYAAGSLYSTVEDLLKWDQALYTDKLLSAELKQKMYTPFLQNYAYGWVVVDPQPGKPPGELTIMHAGGINGFSSQLIRMPNSKRTIIVLGNYPNATSPVSNAINAILHGVNLPPVKRSVVEEIRPVVFKQGAAAGIEKYRALKSKPDQFDFSEGEVNALGYGLMGAGKLPDAIEIFKLNVEEHPASSNVYDSLGEAYMNAGQRDLAIKNYQKAVDLDPKAQNAVDALKKLQSPEPGSKPAGQ